MRSSKRSTSATSPLSISAIARADNAPRMARRTWVCSGGSLNTRLVVWCANSGVSPYLGANSTFLSEEKVRASR